MHTKYLILLMSSLMLFGEQSVKVPMEKLGTEYELIGKLHAPLGKLITVVGVVVEGPFKGYEGGPNLRVQQIQGKYYQKDIQICLSPYFTDWGESAALPKLKNGETYEMEGYETGGFVGVPHEAYSKAGLMIQTSGHYFRHEFVAIKAKLTKPISYAPWMFSGEKALLSGVAKSLAGDAALVGDGWSVIVKRGEKWNDHVEGKKIESYGLYNPDSTAKEEPNRANKTFDLVDGWWRLVALEDQVGRMVALRGTARSMNGVWWFHYRGTDLYVDGMESLPGWTYTNHWQAMQIEGRLEKAKLPSLEQISLKTDRDLVEYYIVRDPKWKPLPELLAPETDLPPPAE